MSPRRKVGKVPVFSHFWVLGFFFNLNNTYLTHEFLPFLKFCDLGLVERGLRRSRQALPGPTAKLLHGLGRVD